MDPRREELYRLSELIKEWNANRLDLFEISMPDETLEFFGVMRFFFQDEGAKLATKCIRVGSSSPTEEVIKILVEKFRPNMKMLDIPTYHLYEINSNGDERRLNPEDCPLRIQLGWGKDDREGRFLLRNAKSKPTKMNEMYENKDEMQPFKRKLSKREKKELKKQQQHQQAANKENASAKGKDDEAPSFFVRTKSNSEAVMKRRQELKIKKKLDEMQREGDQGGMLKVHGEALNPDVPYKGLLLSVNDPASYVVQEMLDKYGIKDEDPRDYCLVQKFNAGEYSGGSRAQEIQVEDGECPLAILQSQVTRGNITFHVKKRDGRRAMADDTCPYLLELGVDGSDLKQAKKHLLPISNVTEVGSQPSPSSGQHLRLIGPTIFPNHAIIAHTEGVVTVTPAARNPDAEIRVEGERIYDATILQHGKIVRFGHHHAFRFWDPKVEEKQRRAGGPAAGQAVPGMDSGPGIDGTGPPAYSPRLQDVLPAGLEFRDEGEAYFLNSCIADVSEGMVQFKLAPAYSLYLAARYRIDRMRPDAPAGEHVERSAVFTLTMANMVREVCEQRCLDSAQDLAFWMANASEILNFFKQDRDLQGHTAQAQDLLADTIQVVFRNLVFVMQNDLHMAMPAFLVDSENDEEAGNVLHVLSSAMSLLRRCRVNAALTIQLFSQLFHFINMWLFNELVRPPPPPGTVPRPPCFTTRTWGARLKRRLDRIGDWAEKQGLELAADCHLSRIKQAAFLLLAPKSTDLEVAQMASTCFKLTSIQLRALLEAYQPEGGPGDDGPVYPHLVESAVTAARNNADLLAQEDGRELKLTEDTDLQLPFLLPDDGYSCDSLMGIPPGLFEFLEPLMDEKTCRLTPLPSQSNMWTVFMPDHESNKGLVSGGGDGGPAPGAGDQPGPPSAPPVPVEPEIATLLLNKVNGSLGLSIVAAKGENQPEKGIYIKSVVGGGAAALEGSLQAGDQLLEVDGKCLIGLAQERAAELMKETGQVVKLKVARQGAIYHGLATLLSPASPVPGPEAGGGPAHPRDGGTFNQPLSSSKSTPMLNNDYANAFQPQPMDQPDMRSKSIANLGGPDSRGPAWDQPPGGAPPPSAGPPRTDYNRAQSQPDLLANVDEPTNYQNYPGSGAPPPRSMQPYQQQQRPVSQFIGNTSQPGGGFGGPQRPKSEFIDPSMGPGGQPIYQNQSGKTGVDDRQPMGSPGYSRNPRLGDIRQTSSQRISPDLPPPPMAAEQAPPVPPHPQDDLPPPPSSNYVNYETNPNRSQGPGAYPRGAGDARGPTSPTTGPPSQPGGPSSYNSPQHQPQYGSRPGPQHQGPSYPKAQPFSSSNQPGGPAESTYPFGRPGQPADMMRGDNFGGARVPDGGVRLAGLAQPPVIAPAGPPGGGWQKDEEERRGPPVPPQEDRRRRDDMIRDLQMKPRLTREEEDKLRRLKADQHCEGRGPDEGMKGLAPEEDWKRKNGGAPSQGSQQPGGMPNQPPLSMQAVRTNLERQERHRQDPNTPSGGPPDPLQQPSRNSYYGRAPGPPSTGPPSSAPDQHVKEVKLNSLPSKTITFKPAYRPDQPGPPPSAGPTGHPQQSGPPGGPPFTGEKPQSVTYKPSKTNSPMDRGPPGRGDIQGRAQQTQYPGQAQDPSTHQPPWMAKDQTVNAKPVGPGHDAGSMPLQSQDRGYPLQRPTADERDPGQNQPVSYPGQGQGYQGRNQGYRPAGQGYQPPQQQPPQQQPSYPDSRGPTNPSAYPGGPPPPERTASSYGMGEAPQQQQQHSQSYRGAPSQPTPAAQPLPSGPVPYRPGPAGYQPPSSASTYNPVSSGAPPSQGPYRGGPAGGSGAGPGSSYPTGPTSYQSQPPGGPAYVPSHPSGPGPAPGNPMGGPQGDPQRRAPGPGAPSAVGMGMDKKSVSFNSNLASDLSPGFEGGPMGARGPPFAYGQREGEPTGSLGGAAGRPGGVPYQPPLVTTPSYSGASVSSQQQQQQQYRPQPGPASAPKPQPMQQQGPPSQRGAPVQMRGAVGRSGPPRDFSSQIEGEPPEEPTEPANTDRMSFKDKMKMFASTAGESTPPQEKPKSSRTQRKLEDVLIYGNGRM